MFEHCVFGRFSSFLATTDSQFQPAPMLFILRAVVSHYTLGGSTVNLAALDISKAFDRVDHRGLFVKLSLVQFFLRIKCGVRQGGVLSPQLFAVYRAVKCRLVWHFRGQALLLRVLHVVACDSVRGCVFLKDDLNRVKKGLNSYELKFSLPTNSQNKLTELN